MLLYVYCRFMYTHEVPFTAKLGRRVAFAHQGCIVIHWLAEIGDDCTISHNVTIGAAKGWDHPTLGKGVQVGVGAVIIGSIRIGDGARIGPNAVVMSNVPPGATVFAPPSRVVILPKQMKG
jgi:serine O-acetyltransferase